MKEPFPAVLLQPDLASAEFEGLVHSPNRLVDGLRLILDVARMRYDYPPDLHERTILTGHSALLFSPVWPFPRLILSDARPALRALATHEAPPFEKGRLIIG